MSWTLCTSGAAISKAGVNANSTICTSGAALEKWSEEAEGRICAECHKDFITDISSLDTGIQYAISDICSSLIALNIIAFDTTGYLTREADILLNLNDDRVTKGLAKLKDKEFQRLS